VQFIDVRDLTDWTVKLIEDGATGIFNATGPEEPIPMGDVLDCCKEVSGSDARFTWVDEAFLLEREVNPWIGLPLWIPESDPETIGFFASSIQKALQSGLTFRPLDETVRDTLAWADTRPEDYQWRAGLDRVKEAKLLKDWHERGSAG
jgi:2'-hydroxyisoflavone reductase